MSIYIYFDWSKNQLSWRERERDNNNIGSAPSSSSLYISLSHTHIWSVSQKLAHIYSFSNLHGLIFSSLLSECFYLWVFFLTKEAGCSDSNTPADWYDNLRDILACRNCRSFGKINYYFLLEWYPFMLDHWKRSEQYLLFIGKWSTYMLRPCSMSEIQEGNISPADPDPTLLGKIVKGLHASPAV